MGLTELKKELQKLDKAKLIELIADMYKKNKSVKEYLDFYVDPNEKELFNTYRTKVIEAFYPKRGDSLKLKDGKKAISDFKKFEPSPELIADLILVYVETGIRFTNDYGDIDEGFYSSLESAYSDALSLMKKVSVLDKFKARAEKAVRDTNGIGWGFHHYLREVYSEFYDEELGSFELKTSIKLSSKRSRI